MLEYLAQGLALGFGNGIAPGPFLALVIASALRGGFRSGAVVALSPLVTDLPIIAVSLTLLSRLPARGVAALSLAGALVLAWYAFEAFRDARTSSLEAMRAGAVAVPSARHALRQGVIANALNPSPWMFWMTVGGPLLTRAWDAAPLDAVAFLVPFYALLIGSKVLVAGAVSAGRSRLGDTGYRRLLAGAGVLLVGLALELARSGLGAFG